MNASEEHTRLLLETNSIMASIVGWLSWATVKDFPYILHCFISDVWMTLTLTLTFVVKLFTPHVNCITLHYITLGPFYNIYKTQVTHLSLNLTLKNEQHTTPLPVQKPLPQHVHPGRLEKKGFNFWWGLKKFSVYQLIHQNLVSHASFTVLWTAESVSFFF
jgi:hypothetical protein